MSSIPTYTYCYANIAVLPCPPAIDPHFQTLLRTKFKHLAFHFHENKQTNKWYVVLPILPVLCQVFARNIYAQWNLSVNDRAKIVWIEITSAYNKNSLNHGQVVEVLGGASSTHVCWTNFLSYSCLLSAAIYIWPRFISPGIY